MVGVITGTKENTIIKKQTTPAICRPGNRSRVMASATTRGPAAPTPCKVRATSIVSRRGARAPRRAPRIKRTELPIAILWRPNVSLSGPVKRVPHPIPTTNVAMPSCTNWASLAKARRQFPVGPAAWRRWRTQRLLQALPKGPPIRSARLVLSLSLLNFTRRNSLVRSARQ